MLSLTRLDNSTNKIFVNSYAFSNLDDVRLSSLLREFVIHKCRFRFRGVLSKTIYLTPI